MLISKACSLQNLPKSTWKNGGGSTRTLAVEPRDACLDDFSWRVSLAEVGESGSFSRFDGIDRTIMLWSGAGLNLQSPTWSQTLDRPYVPIRFRGEEEIVCTLIDGTTFDLNVMVRRGMVQSVVRVEREAVTLTESGNALMLLCATGSWKIRFDDEIVSTISADEFVSITGCGFGVEVLPSCDDAVLVLIRLE